MDSPLKQDDSYKGNEKVGNHNNFEISKNELLRLDRIRRKKRNCNILTMKTANMMLLLNIFTKMFLECSMDTSSISDDDFDNIAELIVRHQKELCSLNSNLYIMEEQLHRNLVVQAEIENARGLEYEKAKLADLKSRKKIIKSNYERQLASLIKRFEYYEQNKDGLETYSLKRCEIQAQINCLL